ncbi:MAG TPA: septal ring lytic transglycosylase RlpA family protein [Chitinophagaceae bacterium]|nr:septal ring lytic transglycosylase RlpA family protein [Chitinophagaceae bacterium]
MKSGLLVLMFIGLFFTYSNAQKKLKHTHSISAKQSLIKYGIASYYAKKFDKRQTASGEIYRSKKYSAACNVLPLHTWIRVTNLRNNKSLVVRTNDRLHPKNKRLIDLSWIAAKDLGYISRGLTRVKIEVLKDFHLARE